MNPQYLFSPTSAPHPLSSYLGGTPPSSFPSSYGLNLVAIQAQIGDEDERWVGVGWKEGEGWKCYRKVVRRKKGNGKEEVMVGVVEDEIVKGNGEGEKGGVKNGVKDEVVDNDAVGWGEDGGWGDSSSDEGGEENLESMLSALEDNDGEDVKMSGGKKTKKKKKKKPSHDNADEEGGEGVDELCGRVYMEEYEPAGGEVLDDRMRKYLDFDDDMDEVVKRQIESEMTNKATSALQRGAHEEDDEDDKDDNVNSALSSSSGAALTRYASEMYNDKTHLVRYSYNDRPLLSSSTFKTPQIRKCENCGGRRRFEFQVVGRVVGVAGLDMGVVELPDFNIGVRDVVVEEKGKGGGGKGGEDEPPPPPQKKGGKKNKKNRLQVDRGNIDPRVKVRGLDERRQ